MEGGDQGGNAGKRPLTNPLRGNPRLFFVP